MSRPAWGAWIEIHLVKPLSRTGLRSRPAWGAWIEIGTIADPARSAHGRAPHGARGLKWQRCHDNALVDHGRAPHGARGLKFCHPDVNKSIWGSRPAWGAWIEIPLAPLRIVPIESRPAWGAWIEIFAYFSDYATTQVAPRMGRVD